MLGLSQADAATGVMLSCLRLFVGVLQQSGGLGLAQWLEPTCALSALLIGKRCSCSCLHTGFLVLLHSSAPGASTVPMCSKAASGVSPGTSSHLILFPAWPWKVQGSGCRQRQDGGEAGRGLLISNAALPRDMRLALRLRGCDCPFWKSMQAPLAAAPLLPRTAGLISISPV